MTLLELAELCEQGADPDRALDCRIWLVATGGLSFELGHAVVPDLGQWQAPAYTASLDAAMTLIPEGWQGDGLKWWAEDGATCALVGATWDGENWVHRFDDGRANGHGLTPPLAICAAALRARHSIQESA